MSGKEGRSGRPPVPIERKRMLGIERADRVPSTSATVAIESAEDAPVPVHLGVEGRMLWVKLVEPIWISTLDLTLVEDLCATTDEISDLRQKIDGMYTLEEPIVTPAGHVVGTKIVSHPLLKELRAAQKHRLDLATQLGFSPVARSRLGLAEIKKVRDKLSELKDQLQNRVS